MAIKEGIRETLVVGRKIVNVEYDYQRDELTVTLENNVRLVVDVKQTTGADGGSYATLHMRTVVGG